MKNRQNNLEFKLDKLHWDILGALQKNSRASLSAIGRKIGLTPQAVAERLKRMEDLGIIEETLLRLSQLVSDFDCFAEIDINPFIASPEKNMCKAVDARFIVKTA